MKRRSFLSCSVLTAIPIAARASDPALETDWSETVSTDVLKFKAVSDDGQITLQVELIRTPENEVTEIKDENGEHHCYRYKGKDMPYPFQPGSTLLTRFDLTWDGKAMNIPDRFWNDLPGLSINSSSLDLTKVDPEFRWGAKEFLGRLRQPRVSLSAHGGTVLIEWERGEECDSSSTIRWIISKSGTVLRHHHCPPHEC